MSSKYQLEVTVRLEESKTLINYGQWSYWQSLKRYVQIYENTQRHDSNSKGVRGRRRSDSFTLKPLIERQPVEALLVDSKRNLESHHTHVFFFVKEFILMTTVTRLQLLQIINVNLLLRVVVSYVSRLVVNLFRECPSSHSRSCCYCEAKGYHHQCIYPKSLLHYLK